MDTLKYIKDKFALRYLVPMPILLPIERQRGLTALFGELGFKTGAEIGVFKARYARWLFSRIRGLKLYCVDPYAVYDKHIELHEPEGQPLFDGYYEFAKENLKGKNAEFIRKYSMDAVGDFADNSLDFVFIDGNHSFTYVLEDIAAWSKKVRPGGIVAGHDYWNSNERKRLYKIGLTPAEPIDPVERISLCQVKTVVNAWTDVNKIKPWFITEEDPGSSGGPSFLWVKQ